MATYTIVEQRLGMQDIQTTDTVQNHKLGTIVRAEHTPDSGTSYGMCEFVYLKGIADTAAGSMVDYNQYTGVTALSPATTGIAMVAVAMSANVANQFGWYCIGGNVPVKAPNAAAVGAEVFALAATPGSVDDAQVDGEQILNAKFSTSTGTPSTGLALIQINRPFHQGQIV